MNFVPNTKPIQILAARQNARPLIHLIAGARPNFMKIAPLWHALHREGEAFDVAIVHTGQHYDHEMSDVFLRQFGLPRPTYMLGAGSGSHAQQTAAVMSAYEGVCLSTRPDLVVVVGDVNSTMAAAIVAKKIVLPVAHLEAGLRSFDRTMPQRKSIGSSPIQLPTYYGPRPQMRMPISRAKVLRSPRSSGSATS